MKVERNELMLSAGITSVPPSRYERFCTRMRVRVRPNSSRVTTVVEPCGSGCTRRSRGLSWALAVETAPAAMAQSAPSSPPAAPAPKGPQYLKFPGKSDKLVLLGERPLVAETPEHLLDDDVTPTEKFFVRNNGILPEESKAGDTWKLTV